MLSGRSIEPCPDFTNESIPDPVPLTDELRRFAKGRTLVGSVGVVDARKGILQLLEVASAAQQQGLDDVAFVVAGLASTEFASRIETTIEERGLENFKFVGRRLEEEEFNATLSTLDVVWVAYKNFPHSSNILTKASLLSRPVLVSDGGLLAHRVSRYGNGAVIRADETDEVLRAIRRLRDQKPSAPAFERYASDHSITRFRELLSEQLQKL